MNFLLVASLGLVAHLLTSLLILVALRASKITPKFNNEKITNTTLLLGSVAVYLYVVATVLFGLMLAVGINSIT